MQLQTSVGWIELGVWHGEDPQDGHWGCPIREHWGLRPHQKMSPTLEDRLVFTATMTSSYEKSSLVSEKWGYKVDDSVIHALVQRLGKKAEEQTKKRLEQLPKELDPHRAPSELGVLMVDGWYARFRGPGWGKKKTKKDRVEWHEIKTGIFYRLEQAGRTEGGRGVISKKAVVRWEKGPLELGRRLHWQALRQGLGRAKEMLVLGDGSKWIWNLAEDRWQDAYQGLDFYHASEHLWELGRAVCGDEKASNAWVKQRLHLLRHGQHTTVLKEVAGLDTPRGERGKIVRRERNYFARQKRRMNYKELADRGWPIGSGAVESECNQDQGRFKRSGQFWTRPGFRHLSALDEARRNEHWDELWLTA